MSRIYDVLGVDILVRTGLIHSAIPCFSPCLLDSSDIQGYIPSLMVLCPPTMPHDNP